MKRYIAAAVALTGLFGFTLFSGCGQGGGAAGGSPRFINLGAAPPGGSFYQVGSALADVLNDHADEVGWQRVNAETTGGSLENLRRLQSGEIQLGMSNSSITYFAVRGEGGFDRKYEVKTAMTLFPLVAMFVTRQSEGIEKMTDLKGRRVVVGPQGAGFEYFVRPILEAHGMSYDDFGDDVRAGFGTSVSYLKDEAVTAAFLGGGKKSPAISSAASTIDIKLVPFDPQARQELIEKYPFYKPVTIPAGTYSGQEEDFAGLNVGSTHLIVRADADDEFVYKVVKLLYENRKALHEKHALLKASVTPENVVVDTGTEFHPGAIRYYKEIGIWPEGGDSQNDDPKSEAGARQAKESDASSRGSGAGVE